MKNPCPRSILGTSDLSVLVLVSNASTWAASQTWAAWERYWTRQGKKSWHGLSWGCHGLEARNRFGIDRGTPKLVRTFNRSMIAWLGKKLGQKENRSTKNFWDRNFRFFSLEIVWKMKILRSKKIWKFSFSENFWDRKKSKIFIENCMKMKNFEIENFRKFSISKIFKFSTLSCSNFLSNQSFLIIFFMDRCKISRRIRWNRLERPVSRFSAGT